MFYRKARLIAQLERELLEEIEVGSQIDQRLQEQEASMESLREMARAAERAYKALRAEVKADE